MMNEQDFSITKIMIVDDHPLLRTGIRNVVEDQVSYRVISEAASAHDAIALINRNKPHLVIVDVLLAGATNGIELVRAIRDRFPEIRTLVLSMYDESLYAERALRAGARGYLMKEVASENIMDAIETIMRGKLYLRAGLSEKIIDKLLFASSSPGGTTIDSLSDRELEIFQLIGNGFSTKEIAEKLNVSIFTVESHKKNTRDKMNFKTTSELVKHAIQWNILQSR